MARFTASDKCEVEEEDDKLEGGVAEKKFKFIFSLAECHYAKIDKESPSLAPHNSGFLT